MAEHRTVSPTMDANGKLAEFTLALTDVSRRLGIGIAGAPTLFIMETDRDVDDFNRSYRVDAESRLIFD